MHRNTIPNSDLLKFLLFKANQYNNQQFIETDPISVPRMFTEKKDIEIAGFLTSIISWGNRKAIIKAAKELLNLMDMQPFFFISNASGTEVNALRKFYYRTLNGDDIVFLVSALKRIYSKYGGLENIFTQGFLKDNTVFSSLCHVHDLIFNEPHLHRSEKHIPSPKKGSASKRLNMYLRWMVRNGNSGVDFALWKNIPASSLHCPLDVHSGRVARKLGLLLRSQNDWKAVVELTNNLKLIYPEDPVLFDFALFGLGKFENF